MGDRYRVIIKGKKIHKEIQIDPETEIVKFGTSVDCDVRVRKELFISVPFEIVFSKDVAGKWSIMCSDNLYIAADEVRKLFNQPLNHGAELLIKHKDSAISFFTVSFLIDFDYEHKDYDARFNISSLSNISIGSQSDNNIIIGGKYIRGDKVYLIRQGNDFLLRIAATEYGVYHNGELVKSDVIIRENDFFSIANISFCYRRGMLFTQGTDNIRGNGIEVKKAVRRGSYPKFIRNSRIKNELPETKIEILDPPPVPKKQNNNKLSSIITPVIMAIVSLFMGVVGGVFIFVGIASAAAGIISAVYNMREAKKQYNSNVNERINKYNAYIQKKREEIINNRNAELDNLREKYISEKVEIDNFKKFSSDLFDRRTKDDDFLEVRLGVGNVASKIAIDYKKQERLEIEDELQLYPENMAKQYEYLIDAPIICNFKQANAIGIIGNVNCRYSMLKNILVDICARQYHSDIKMFFVAKEEHADVVKNLRMLPQVYNESLGIYNIVCNDSSRTVIFEYLYKELSLREQSKAKLPHILVFFYDEYEFKSHPISKFVDSAKDLGVTFVFFGQTRAEICQGCDYIIQMTDDEHGLLINTEDGRNNSSFVINPVSNGDIFALIQLMAPVYTEEISLEGTLTKNISLFEMLGVIATYDIDLKKQWSQSKVYQSLAAPIGVSKSGTLELDLHDKAHGPHGLVAGTTGSGKSELLQSYIMSMATKYHPYEVGFVIIDFKGGGMANQFEKLPHLIGTITNIDGKEINRSLRSIKAELQKRQRLFKEAEVNHIDKYIIKFKEGKAGVPLPHLIVIVDEFAELKANHPEFMKELISAARIGRSLGVHLILATQKPSGQVDDQIWSNSRFKLCLKVQSGQDSNEVIKSPVAAEIKEPGRAYLQVGNNEIFELFQSAYSGAPEHEDDSDTKEFVIYEKTEDGKRVPVYIQKKKKNDGANNTQLDAVVKYVAEYCKNEGIRKLQSICLPALEKVINFSESVFGANKGNSIVTEIGIYDDPDNQIQDVYSIDLTNQNVMIIGSSQSGKTNLLQTIIRSLASKYSSKEVNMYILDFGSMILKNYEGLNHVGGVVYAHEEEKCKNLFKLLAKEIKQRKEILNSVGVSSYSAYKEAGFKDLPQIVLLIDNLTVMRELYLLDNDFLLPICRDGLSAGISVVVANTQTSGIGYKYLSNFEQRIAFYCNDTTEYNIVFDYCRMQFDAIAGRCLISIDKEIYEMQSFLAFDGDKEIERVNQIAELIRVLNENNKEHKAKSIPFIPEKLTERSLIDEYGAINNKDKMAIGLEFENVSPIYINWDKQSVFGILGRREKSKKYFMNYMKKTLCEIGAAIYIIDDYSGEYEDINTNDSVKLYSKKAEDAKEILDEISQTLLERYVERDMKGVSAVHDMEPIVLLIHNQDVASTISGNMQMLNIYKDIVGKYKGLKCCVIFSNMANENFTFGSGSNSNDVMRQMKDNPQFLIFEDIKDIKVFDVTQSLSRKFGTLKDEECYLRLGNELSKVKIVG